MMRALALLGLVLAGCQSLTDVVVRIDSADVTAADISSISITVTDVDGNDGGTPFFSTQPLPLCTAGQKEACYSFPITLTLAPGSHSPATKVRVEVDAEGTDGKPFSSDAALFTFTPHAEKSLDFFLSQNCSGTDCASANLACDSAGACGELATTSGNKPDLAMPALPATQVTRTSFTTGIHETTPGTSFSIPVPDTQPGDLIVVGLVSANATAPQAVPTGWKLLGQASTLSAVLYRFADGSEAGSGVFDFVEAPTGGMVFDVGTWAMITFRGATTPIHAATESVISGVNKQFTIPMDDGASLVPGGDLVGIVLVVDNLPTCTPPNSNVVLHSATGTALIEIHGTTSGPPGTIDVSCSDENTSPANDVYQFVLSPAQ